LSHYLEALESYQAAFEVEKNVSAAIFFYLGRTTFKLSRYTEAIEHFNKALRLDETFLMALAKRAKAHRKLNEHEECVIDCAEFLGFEDSASLQEIVEKQKSIKSKWEFQKTVEKLKSIKSKCQFVVDTEYYTTFVNSEGRTCRCRNPDRHYAALGVPNGSSQQDIIKKGYREMSLKYHTDKNREATTVEKKKLALRFNAAKEAHDYLT
jgi:tetratricopeptide (TPR) repeat protein